MNGKEKFKDEFGDRFKGIVSRIELIEERFDKLVDFLETDFYFWEERERTGVNGII